MIKLATFYTAIALSLFAFTYGNAQEVEARTTLEVLNDAKESIIQQEKAALKEEVENINKRVLSGNLTEAEADTLKKEAAEKHALNIENRIAIIDNKIALFERNGDVEIEGESGITIRIGSSVKDDDQVIYVGPKLHKRKYDRRTTSAFVFAFGLNNVVTEGESIDDSDFKIGGSRFTEIGWAWKTRVFKNSNWLRFKCGFSFQYNGLKPTDNRYYVTNGDQTDLVTHPIDLDKSKFRMDNLVVPLHFEFGPSRKIEHDDYFRYSTHKQIKIGLGGYAGLNLSTRQKLKYEEDGEDVKKKLKSGYNTNNFIYGLSGYIGWNGVALYAKYDLNTIFTDNPVDQRNVSLGLRFDVD